MTLPAPSGLLPYAITDLLRTHAFAAERQRDLHPAVLELLYREEWFRMLVPQRWGGRALSLPQLVRLEEALGWADGSVGWTVTLCSGAGWFAGFFPPGSPPESPPTSPPTSPTTSPTTSLSGLFADKHLCIAGSGSPTGEAHRVKEGYRVSGRWAYASGALHATAYTANCVVWKDGAALRGEDGEPVIRPFLFLPVEVQVHRDWNAMGLIATGSHGFSVTEVVVPAERAFVIDAAAATDADPLYRYPFLPLAEATLAANVSGMGQHFLDCCAELFPRRGKPEADGLLARAQVDVATKREAFYRAVDESWDAVAAGLTSPELFDVVSRASHALAAGVRQWVHRLYPFAGLGAARVDTEINRVWRDLHTAGQHPLLV